MRGEVCAFIDAFDAAFIRKRYIMELFGYTMELFGAYIPIVIVTDSKKLFISMTKDICSTEKPLLIGISSIRQSYKRFKISCNRTNQVNQQSS